MGGESKSLDELLNQLPRESWAEVRDFIESLLHKQGSRPARHSGGQKTLALEDHVDRKQGSRRARHSEEKTIFRVGDRVEQMCITCGEERGHIVASITKKGKITRVSCPICGSRVPYTRSGNAISSPNKGRTHSQERIGHLPPQNETDHKLPERLRQGWAGALSEYRHTFDSLTLQKKSLDWRGD